MDKVYVLDKDDLGGELYRRIHLLLRKNRGTWQAVGAAAGIACGVLSLVLGLLLWAGTRLSAPGSFASLLDGLSTALLLLPLPLLAFGACCLDLLEKKHPALPLPFDPQPARRGATSPPPTPMPR